MKKILSIGLAALMLAALFGCAPQADTAKELWVVTEATTWDCMNGQAAVLAEQFEKTHEGVTVRLDILPTDEQERSVYLQQLRTQILRGGGPDVYLLPTSNVLTLDEAFGYSDVEIEPLFPDALQAMRNGMFRDISDLYDGDTELGKEALLTEVMDAGVVDDSRYILPLRWDIPVIYADTQALEESGIDPAVLEQGIDELMEAILRTGDPQWAAGAEYGGLSAFTQWLDYDGQQVDLSQEQIALFLQQYQAVQALRAGTDMVSMDVENYIQGAYIAGTYSLELYPLYIGTLSDILDYAPVYQYEEKPLTVLPLRAMGGDVVANVTYYGAVGAGCDDSETAYEFLRMFLSEESQWEENRPQSQNAVGEKGRKINTTNASQHPGLIGDGWPVRVAGSLNPLWRVRVQQFYNSRVQYSDENLQSRMRKISRSDLEATWMSALNVKPDQVRFGTSLTETFAQVLSSLNDPDTSAPQNVDVSALAEEFHWQLRWHVAEG